MGISRNSREFVHGGTLAGVSIQARVFYARSGFNVRNQTAKLFSGSLRTAAE
jgi:hypothetical protein